MLTAPDLRHTSLSPGKGDVLQGAAADCKSAGETHAWFDSRIPHQSLPLEPAGICNKRDEGGIAARTIWRLAEQQPRGTSVDRFGERALDDDRLVVALTRFCPVSMTELLTAREPIKQRIGR